VNNLATKKVGYIYLINSYKKIFKGMNILFPDCFLLNPMPLKRFEGKDKPKIIVWLCFNSDLTQQKLFLITYE